VKEIKERIEMCKKYETMPGINIFPEGSITNGLALMKF